VKKLEDYSPQDIQALLESEAWTRPLAPVARARFKPWQQAVFWALRLYIVAMLIVVFWAFWHGKGA
jgi:hypothetical protein